VNEGEPTSSAQTRGAESPGGEGRGTAEQPGDVAAPAWEQSRTLEESPRFAPPPTRRDWLGLAGVWSAVAALAAAVIGSVRLPMPSVFPESSSKVKIGPPDSFAPASATYLPQLSAWVFRDQQGLYAISSVCTHLGCISKRMDNEEFLCPCHGSVFASDGKVMVGPAPKGLNWLAMSLSPDGQVVVDKVRTVQAGTHFAA
jgi:cytochrome b6-f complex iron-sulfur subunit